MNKSIVNIAIWLAIIWGAWYAYQKYAMKGKGK